MNTFRGAVIVAIGTKCKVTVHSYHNETPSAFTVHAPPHAYPLTYTHTDRGERDSIMQRHDRVWDSYKVAQFHHQIGFMVQEPPTTRTQEGTY